MRGGFLFLWSNASGIRTLKTKWFLKNLKRMRMKMRRRMRMRKRMKKKMRVRKKIQSPNTGK